jgi:nucleoside 2-deoxyribosyltransferase
LFCDAERSFNLTVDEALRTAGLDTYLPQRDGGEGAKMVASGMDPSVVRSKLFASDTEAIRRCDFLIMLLDGRVPDEGACVELGIAYALEKPCFGLQTDIRRFADQSNNLMIDSILIDTADTVDDLIRDVTNFAQRVLTKEQP